jgi:prophage maintenance system killer protein
MQEYQKEMVQDQVKITQFSELQTILRDQAEMEKVPKHELDTFVSFSSNYEQEKLLSHSLIKGNERQATVFMLSNLGHLYGYTFELMIKQSISQS